MIEVFSTTVAYGILAVSSGCTVLYTYDLLKFTTHSIFNRS
jgi:hypothetical protein